MELQQLDEGKEIRGLLGQVDMEIIEVILIVHWFERELTSIMMGKGDDFSG